LLDDEGQNALCLASICEHEEVVRVLTETGSSFS